MMRVAAHLISARYTARRHARPQRPVRLRQELRSESDRPPPRHDPQPGLGGHGLRHGGRPPGPATPAARRRRGLDIPDDYEYMDPELADLLEDRVERALESIRRTINEPA